jgi:hypothetical protein
MNCGKVLFVGIGCASLAAMDAHARVDERGNPMEEVPPRFRGPVLRVDEFAGWFHDAGNLLLHVSNRGYFGRQGADQTNPSAEWPAGSNDEYLYAAGLWVGGVIDRGGIQDTLVSCGLYQFGEWYNHEPNEGCGSPPVGICQTFEGAPNGLRNFDDDGDGLADEDELDGTDNDGDGRVDEDFAGISQQMFRTVYYDTSMFFNQFFSQPENHHRPIGLAVVQESYVWTDPQFDDFVGIEFRITNMTHVLNNGVGDTIRDCYIGFMVDGDVGFDDEDLTYWTDDQGAFAELDTTIASETGGSPIDLHLTMGYIYDENGGENSADDVPGYCGVMFLGHTVDTTAADFETSLAPPEVGIHAFRVWSGGDQDPRDDLDRYRFLRGLFDTARTIDPPTSRPLDYRFLVSAGPFKQIEPESTLTFQVAFVSGLMRDEPQEDGSTRRVPDLANPIQAQRVYNGFFDEALGIQVHWATSSPPPPPKINVQPGDRNVVVEWDDFPEGVPDPLTRDFDFAGYQVWKAEGWRRESNIPSDEMWRLIADYDTTELSQIDTGLSGIGKYRFVDTRVQNGFFYWYAVTAYDRGIFQADTTDSGIQMIRVPGGEPKYGKFSQNMTLVMPSTTPTQTLDDVYVVPNPYKENAAWDLAETSFEPTGRRIKFFNLPARATIRIYTLAGDHVQTIEHDDNAATSQGQASWNLISKNNQDTVSGMYIYHVQDRATGQEMVGKFAIIR